MLNFLLILSNLSDLVGLPDDFFVKGEYIEHTKIFLRKITVFQTSPLIIQNLPTTCILFVLVLITNLVLKFIKFNFYSSGPITKLNYVSQKISNFKVYLIELNILDLIFSAFLNSLNTSKFKLEDQTRGSLLGYLISYLMIIDLTFDEIKGIQVAFKDNLKVKENEKLRRLLITEGLDKETLVVHPSIVLVNLFFRLRMLVLAIVLITFQKYNTTSLMLIFINEIITALVFLVLKFKVIKRANLFESWWSLASFVLVGFVMILFTLSALYLDSYRVEYLKFEFAKSIKLYDIATVVIIVAVLLCILTEVALGFIGFYNGIKKAWASWKNRRNANKVGALDIHSKTPSNKLEHIYGDNPFEEEDILFQKKTSNKLNNMDILPQKGFKRFKG